MLRIRGFEWPLAATIAAAALLAAPLWCVAAPAMPDYPAHLASFALIAGRTSRYYTVAWDFLPNLASEAIVPLLGRLMPLEAATKLFLTATVALWVLGPAAIQRALFGRVGPGVLLSAFFAYNANFMWGFFNYSFAVGLDFFVFAAWIASDGRRGLKRQLGFAAAFTLIYFCHLFALGILVLAVTCFELSGWLAEPRRTPRGLGARAISIALLCLPAAFAFLVLKPPGADSRHLEFNLYDTMADRFGAAIQFGFDNPVYPLTAVLLLIFAGGFLSKRMTVHPRMRIALAVLATCTLIAPEWAFGGWGVHMRLPAVLGALAFASVEWKFPARVLTLGAAIALAVLAAGAAVLAKDWRSYDAQFAAFRAHAGAITAEARLLTVLDGDSLGMASDQPYWHMAEFAVIDRGVFTPLMFTTQGQHIVHIRRPFDRIAAASAQQGSPPDIDELDDLAASRLSVDEDYSDIYPYLLRFQCHFDAALVIHGAGAHARVPAMLRLRQDGGFYTLYDIVPDKHCAGR